MAISYPSADPVRRPGCFSGDVLRIADLGNMVLTEVRTPSDTEVAAHSHERAYLELVMEGRWSEATDSDVREMDPWTVLFHPRGECHRNTFFSEPALSIHVELADDWLERVVRPPFDPAVRLESRTPEVAAPMVRLARELRQMDSWSALRVEGLVLETLALLGKTQVRRPSRVAPPWLQDLELMLRDPSTVPVSLTAAAKALGTDPSVLTRTFQRHYGCPPSEYLRRLRVERAAVALTKSDVPLSSVAARFGFSDQSHLTRVFRRYTGLTPGAYRARATPNRPQASKEHTDDTHQLASIPGRRDRRRDGRHGDDSNRTGPVGFNT